MVGRPRSRARQGAAAEPTNQSRGAGRAAPESVAATRPRPDPDAPSNELEAYIADTERRFSPGPLESNDHFDPRQPTAPLEPEKAAAVEAERERSLPVDADSTAAPEVANALIDEHLTDGDYQRKDRDRETGPDDPGRVPTERLLDGDYHIGESLEARIERIRRQGRRIGEFTQKLALAKIPGYHTHWFNDEGGRIDDALDNGWDFRKDREGRNLKRAVGMGRDKGVLYAYAMIIPEVFWREDMQVRHDAASAKMDALKANPFPVRPGMAEKSDQGKFYSPNEVADPLQVVKR